MRSVAHTFGQIAERAALGWQLYRDAAAVDPEIAADHDELERLRRRTLTGAISRIDDGSLRPGVTRDDAIDTVFVVASPQSHQMLVHDRGYTLDQYEAWITRTLVAGLLPDPPRGPRRGIVP